MQELVERYGFRPSHCVWELTLKCNMRCKHCGSAAGLEREEELTTEEALRVCDDLAALGNRQITLSGGEPLLRHDWEVLAARLSGHGIRVNMISNGYLIDDEVVQKAKDAGLVNIGVSLDGTKRTHEDIRNMPGAFDRVRRGWEACRRGGLPSSVVTCIFNWNIGELEEIYAILLEGGVTSWQIQIAEPMGNMEQWHDGLIGLDDVPRLLDLYARVSREGRMRVVLADCLGYYSPQEFDYPRFPKTAPARFWTGCYAGCRVVGIFSNGDVNGCLSIRDPRYIEGNVRRSSLREIWNREGAFAFNRGFKSDQLGGACARCEYRVLCRGGCTSMSVALTGEPHADPLCYQALRMRQLEAVRAEQAAAAPR